MSHLAVDTDCSTVVGLVAVDLVLVFFFWGCTLEGSEGFSTNLTLYCFYRGLASSLLSELPSGLRSYGMRTRGVSQG